MNCISVAVRCAKLTALPRTEHDRIDQCVPFRQSRHVFQDPRMCHAPVRMTEEDDSTVLPRSVEVVQSFRCVRIDITVEILPHGRDDPTFVVKVPSLARLEEIAHELFPRCRLEMTWIPKLLTDLRLEWDENRVG